MKEGRKEGFCGYYRVMQRIFVKNLFCIVTIAGIIGNYKCDKIAEN